MAQCIDCQEDLPEGGRNCPFCGSPTAISIPSDTELRMRHAQSVGKGNMQRISWQLFTFLLLLGLAALIFYVSRVINTRLTTLNRGF